MEIGNLKENNLTNEQNIVHHLNWNEIFPMDLPDNVD